MVCKFTKPTDSNVDILHFLAEHLRVTSERLKRSEEDLKLLAELNASACGALEEIEQSIPNVNAPHAEQRLNDILKGSDAVGENLRALQKELDASQEYLEASQQLLDLVQLSILGSD